MIKNVLFDLDGTLINSSEGIIKSVLFTLNHYGIEETNIEGLKRFIGPPLADSFVKYYGFSKEKGKEAVDVYRTRYNVKGLYECELYPGIKELLVSLKDKGYRIGVATSKPEITSLQILEHLGVKELFDEIAGATMDGSIEKKVDVLELAFRRQPEFAKEETVLVGDTNFDILGANQAGIRAIGVSFGFGDAEVMKAAGAVCICDSASEIIDAIASIS